MPRPPRTTLDLFANNITWSFPTHSLEGFQDAPGFLDFLSRRGSLSNVNVVYYVKLVAKLKRRGRLHYPDSLQNRVDRTAARAYWSWIRETYDARVSPVLRAFANASVSKGIRWLRVGSLLPPNPEKLLHYRPLPAVARVGEAVRSVPCPDLWTLHVPRKEGTPYHADPCIDDCDIVVIQKAGQAHQLETIAIAFEKAWGHRDLASVAPDAWLFGQPPISERVQYEKPAQRVIGLVKDSHSPIAGAVDSVGGSITNLPDVFEYRLRMEEQIADVAMIDFSSTLPTARIPEVLATVQTAWLRWRENAARDLPSPTPRAGAVLPDGVERFKPYVPLDSLPGPRPPIVGDMPSSDVPSVSIPSGLPGQPQPAGLAQPPVPSDHFSLLPPAPPPAASTEPYVPIDWAQTVRTKLVHCTVHRTAHSVKLDAEPCGEGAWTDIRM